MSDDVYERVGDKTSRAKNEECRKTIFSDLRSCVNYDASIVMTFIDISRDKLKVQDWADKILWKL